jgi:Mycolic acid cyclopropane synthetase
MQSNSVTFSEMDSQDKPNAVPRSSTACRISTTMEESKSSTGTPYADRKATSEDGDAAGDDDDHNLAPFNPSSDTSIAMALEMLNLQDDDVLFDLGCGDGRILIRAVQSRPDCRCVGIEIDNVFASRADEAICQQLSREEQRRIEIRKQDLLETAGAAGTAAVPLPSVDNVHVNNDNNNAHDESATDFVGADCRDLSLLDDATALYLYLLPRGLKKLEKVVTRRKELGKAFRVVAYTFQVVGWDPVIINRATKSGVPIYLYQFDP